MIDILAIIRKKLGGSLPEDFLTWMEVVIGVSADLMACSGGPDSWYTNMDKLLAAKGFSDTETQQIKIWSSDYPVNMPVCGSWILPASRFVIQNDDHDQQVPGNSERPLGNKGSVLVIDKDVPKHRGFEVLLFNRTDADWHIKTVLSSFQWSSTGGLGYPDGLSDCSQYTGSIAPGNCIGIAKDQAYVDGTCGYTMAAGKYTRVHRDIAIVNAMRAWVGLPATNGAALGLPGCV